MALGRWTSRLLQILGFAGLALCIALAVGILLGRSFVSVTVGDVFVTADTSISSGLASIDDATGRISEGVGRLEELLGELGPLSASAPIPAAVAARISTVVDAYAPARDRYVAAREQARSALQNVQQAAQFVPGVELPTGVSDALAAADERLTGIDAALTGLRSAARATAGDVASAATNLRDASTTAVDTAGSLRTSVDDLRIRIADVHVTVDRVLWLGTGALLAIVGYVALLNILVIWLARRRPTVAPTTDAGPAPSEASRARDLASLSGFSATRIRKHEKVDSSTTRRPARSQRSTNVERVSISLPQVSSNHWATAPKRPGICCRPGSVSGIASSKMTK